MTTNDTITVKTQQELDEALSADTYKRITIRTPAPLRFVLRGDASTRVDAHDSAHVVAYDSARVDAYDSAHVDAYDSAHVEAYGSAHVEAYDSARVVAHGSAHVDAHDSAHVEARDWAHVEASGSARVVASGSAHVDAYDSARVDAGSHVIVRKHSWSASVTGGIQVDHTDIDLDDGPTWAGFHGVKVVDGEAILFKAVSPGMTTGEKYGKLTRWAVGQTVSAPDWEASVRCGRGLHASPSPRLAKTHRHHDEATRFLRVSTPLAGLIPLNGDKAKARSYRVLAEVDEFGDDITS